MGVRFQEIIEVSGKIITMLLGRHPSHSAPERLSELVRWLAFS